MERSLSDADLRSINFKPTTRNPKADRRKAHFSYVPPEMDRRRGKDRRKESKTRELEFTL